MSDGLPIDPPADEVFAELRDHVGPGLSLAARLIGRDAYEVEAEGAIVRLSDGREVLDFSSYAVNLIGHCNPAVVEATTAQLQRLPTSTRVLANAQQAGFATELLERVGGPYSRVWIGTNGADAVEAVLKLARRSSGKPRILALRDAFHGKSLGALGVTYNPSFRLGLEEVAGHGVTHIDPDDPDAVAREVAQGDVAGLLYEPIRGEAGVRPVPVEILKQWQQDARAAGAWLISDEIQIGMGRCGGFSVALEYGLTPDAILYGKALGGGVMPLAAVVATEELFSPLAKDATYHSLTFGGHPLSCAAGRAGLRELSRLEANEPRIAAAFETRLREIAAAHPQVFADVRGRGLLWGLDLQTPGLAGEMLLFMAEHGVLSSPCFSAKTVLRLFPPLCLTDAQLEQAFTAIERAAIDCEEQVLEAEQSDAAAATREGARS